MVKDGLQRKVLVSRINSDGNEASVGISSLDGQEILIYKDDNGD